METETGTERNPVLTKVLWGVIVILTTLLSSFILSDRSDVKADVTELKRWRGEIDQLAAERGEKYKNIDADLTFIKNQLSLLQIEVKRNSETTIRIETKLEK